MTTSGARSLDYTQLTANVLVVHDLSGRIVARTQDLPPAHLSNGTAGRGPGRIEGVGVASRSALIALTCGVVVVLPAAASCTSHRGLAAPALASSTASSVTVTGSPQVPAGSAIATPQPASKLAAYPVDSGVSVGVGSFTSEATYQARITVTVTPRPDVASSSSSAAATELEVAHVEIKVQSGTYVYKADDFMYLGADGNVYPPIAAASVGNALQSGAVKHGRSAEGEVVFRVPFGGGFVQLYGPLGARAAWRTPT